MRKLWPLVLAILLSSCATSNSSRYAEAVSSWQGGSLQALKQAWGKSFYTVQNPSGNSYYVYKTMGYNVDNGPMGPSVGLHLRRQGGAVILTEPSTNSTWNRGMTRRDCYAIFEVNSQNRIVKTKSEGHNCYFNNQFMRKS